MKRFRIVGFDFDSRVRLLDPIQDTWDGHVKLIHSQNRERTILGLKEEFGIRRFDEKLQNFIDLDVKPFSVLAFHNRFYAEARSAFVHCQYYPALTGVCALGERVLNHLILGLRDHYKASPHYQRVYRKSSFDNWNVAINALQDWGVLTAEAEENFRELNTCRNEAIHFNAATAANTRQDALAALLIFGRIIESQFAAFGRLPWLFMSPGEVYIRQKWETSPFIQLVYVPNSIHVGHRHKIVSINPWQIEDQDDYEAREISDEEFVNLRSTPQSAG